MAHWLQNSDTGHKQKPGFEMPIGPHWRERSPHDLVPLPGRIAALGWLLAVACTPVCAEIDMLSMTSNARFTSALVAPPPYFSGWSVTSTAEWIAQGRHASTATLAGQPPSSPFSVDQVLAWADFQRIDEGGFHSLARVSGYYLDAGPWNYTHNEISLTNRYLIEYAATSGPFLHVNVTHTSHGFLLAGGLASNLRARAEEQVTWGLRQASDAPVLPYIAQGAWLGSAEVTPNGPPAATDDWRTRWFPATRDVDGVHLQGLELSVLLAGDAFDMAPGNKLFLDVIFHGVYEVRDTGDTGFLSMALADFSHSGALGLQAIDADTGLPSSALKITLLGAVPAVPEPSVALLLALGLCGVLLRRRIRPACC